jgi:hypothetical protein
MSGQKKLRACLMCSFVATPVEFRKEGCPNCEEYLEVRPRPDALSLVALGANPPRLCCHS